MNPPLLSILAGFTAPMEIGTSAASMLWMFPLLGSIAIIYKLTRLRILFLKQLISESLVLFLTLSGFMILAGIVLNLVGWLTTG